MDGQCFFDSSPAPIPLTTPNKYITRPRSVPTAASARAQVRAQRASVMAIYYRQRLRINP